MAINKATLFERFLLLFCKKQVTTDIGKYCTATLTFKRLGNRLFVVKGETKENAKN